MDENQGSEFLVAYYSFNKLFQDFNFFFQAPQPAKPWDGVLDATSPSPFCYQKAFLMSQTGMQGQEDCLYINVFTPNVGKNYKQLYKINWNFFLYYIISSSINIFFS